MKKLSALLYLSLVASMIHGMQKQESSDIPDEETFFATLAKRYSIEEDFVKDLIKKEQECRKNGLKRMNWNATDIPCDELLRAHIYSKYFNQEGAAVIFYEMLQQKGFDVEAPDIEMVIKAILVNLREQNAQLMIGQLEGRKEELKEERDK